VNPTPDRLDDQAEDPRLLRAAQEYLAELEAGRRPRRRDFAARYPDLAEALLPYLDALDLFQTAAPKLRSSAPRPADPPPAEPLGDFRIVREIGRGGMGVVYEAVQMSLGRRVALKVLPFAAALDAKQLQRFQNEAQAAAALHHTNIVPVYAVGVERGTHYYAMQMIEGQNVADLIAKMRPEESGAGRPPRDLGQVTTGPVEAVTAEPPPAPMTLTGAAAQLSTQRASRAGGFYRTVASLGAQAAEALEHAHQLGVIHRDIKPGNLLVDGRGNLWVTDFGLAQFHNRAGLTRTGDLLGTLRYMSPEQAAGQGAPLDPRTDVYSLGATLYEMLTLEPMFGGGDHARLLRQILYDEPRPLRAVEKTVPEELETIILKAVSKSPSDRYATAQEFADDLHRFLEYQPIRARRPTLVHRVRKWGRRHPSVVVASVVLLVLLTLASLASAALVLGEQAKTKHANEELTKQEAQTREARDRANQRAQEAELQYRLARKAVDELIQISEMELAGRPDLEGLRRLLLDTALDYYQHVIAQHLDVPAADQADLLDTKQRVQRIIDDLTVLQGDRQLFLLSQEAVLKDLGVSEKQQAKLGDALALPKMDAPREKNADPFREWTSLSSEQRQKRLADAARVKEEKVKAILTPSQRARLGQIALQVKGVGAFREADVSIALKLSADQRKLLRDIEGESFAPTGRGHGRPPWEWSKAEAEAKWKEFEEKRKVAMEHALKELTPEQRQLWQEMTGKTYEGPATPPFFMFGHGGRGGFGGGPGGPGGGRGGPGGPDGSPPPEPRND
jgi:serine/threonine protein kinase